MRLTFSILFALMIPILGVCAVSSYFSRKKIGKAVALLNISLIPPIIGNLNVIGSADSRIAYIGNYIYFIGMNLVMYALVRFAVVYCKGAGKGQKVPSFIYILLILDAIQLLLNPIFHHAFKMKTIEVNGSEYFIIEPYIGQMIHRIVDYGVLAGILLVFILIVIQNPKVYREKYSVILFVMIAISIWQSVCVFSQTLINTSMIGFGLLGLLIFYFSLHYRPLRLLDRMLSDIASEMPEALFVFDPSGICVWANEQGCQLAGIKSSTYDLASEKLLNIFGEALQNISSKAEECCISRNETAHYYTLEEHLVKDEKKKLTGSYLRIRDITQEKSKIEQELYNASHDSLTGLYTREYLYKRISETLKAHPDDTYLILFADVKNFKIVNDIFGSDFGDYTLQSIAEWGRKTLSERCEFGRLAGDTFGICMPAEEFNSVVLEEKLADFIVRNEKAEYQLLMHFGVYAVGKTETDVSVMFDRAHLALTTIKDEYNTHIAYYDTEIRQKLLWNQEISAQLHQAIDTRRLRPYLQPIADETGKIVGAEALVRWIHPEYGFMSPGSFIPVFEKNGMIVEVDKYMWRCACEILQHWKQEKRDLFISVNISPKDFYFTDVVAEIKNLVSEYDIDPYRLRIEITETVMMNDADNRMEILNVFRESGFIVEMDDFGSGYSSLNMLKDMPVDVLKIDMKFLGKTKDTDKARTIVKNIINLSKELGITALTEGVETLIQYQALSEMGCKLFQGYYFAKPMPVDQFEQFTNNCI